MLGVLTSIVAVIGNYAVLLALHVPYAFVLSDLGGVLDLVPLVGSTVGGAIVALVALLHGGLCADQAVGGAWRGVLRWLRQPRERLG